MAYPSGIGTNFSDPRKTNYTKTQSLGYTNGVNALKDFAETTSNPAPRPRDMLGTNLRRGKGLTFTKGVATFGGFVQGSAVKGDTNNMSLSATAARENRPLSASYSNGREITGYQQQARTLSAQRNSGRAGVSIAEDQPSSMNDRDRQGPRQEYGRDDISSTSRQGLRMRPHSAPASRSSQQGLPQWAQENQFIPSWDKTVENSKPRPGSAKYRPSSGLPLSFIPQWISLDKKVLSYEAYFKEAVDESPLEKSRVRRCVIQYFLEDDTIKVSEPREENSGMPQGSFLKRHKVPKGADGIVTWRDIAVPGDLTLYGRTFRVIRCDDFTAQFYHAHGAAVDPAAEDVPVDPLHRMIARSRPSSAKTHNSYCLLGSSIGRAAERPAGKPGSPLVPSDGGGVFYGRQINDLKGYMEAQLGRCQDRKELVSKYLANDRKVLRFYCSWDAPGADGVVERRPFVLHFFLADDTVEVLEVNAPNSGRDPFPALLKRMKLPVAYGGTAAGITGTGGGGERHYTAGDLRLGGVVSVFGRQLVLNSCDESTARYYREELGVEMRPAAAAGRPARPQSAVVVPPHNGFGREEDSRQNCLSLHPKPPRQNVIRLLENKGKLLRFVGKIEHATGFDVERVFVVSYFLDTDEITVFEPPVKNSGRSGGKFAERCRVRKPGGADYYAEADMHLGARLVVNSRVFVLVDADEFTMRYMEAHPEVFPLSDVDSIARKVAAAAARGGGGGGGVGAIEGELRRRADPDGTGEADPEGFKAALMAAVPDLQEQEVHALARSLAAPGAPDRVRYEPLLRRAASPAGGGGGGGGGGGPGSALAASRHGGGGGSAQSKAASRRGFAGTAAGGDGGGGGDETEEALARLRELLYRRGPAGLRGLERAMRHVSRGGGHLDRADLDTVLGYCGVSLSDAHAAAVFARFDGGDGVLRGADLCAALRPRLGGAAAAAVGQVFESLEDPTFRTGAVEVDEVLDRFRPGRHPRVFAGDMSEAEARRELEEALEGLSAVVVGDLEAYYADVVAGYGLSDEELLELLRLTWGLGGRR